MRNKHIKHTHFSERKFREILRLFSEDLTAVQISNLSGSNRNSVNRLLRLIQERIYELTRCRALSTERSKWMNLSLRRRGSSEKGEGAPMGKRFSLAFIEVTGRFIPSCSRTARGSRSKRLSRARSILIASSIRRNAGAISPLKNAVLCKMYRVGCPIEPIFNLYLQGNLPKAPS